jgi:cystathionine beta-lyase
VLVLCNPHNPLGDVLTADELRATSEVVARHGGRVFADEVHGPLVYEPHRHVPYASVSPEAAAHTITATSASKAWNLPGLRCAQVVLANRADRRAWDALDRLVTDVPAPLGIIAATTAYDHGRGWLDELRARLDANRRLLAAEVERRLPGVRHRPPEGTFLAWLDLTDVVAPGTDVAARLAAEARVLTLGGVEMGVAPECVRLNFATTEDVLADLVDRLVSVVGDPQPGAARPP